jgi:hypothetical protein
MYITSVAVVVKSFFLMVNNVLGLHKSVITENINSIFLNYWFSKLGLKRGQDLWQKSNSSHMVPHTLSGNC